MRYLLHHKGLSVRCSSAKSYNRKDKAFVLPEPASDEPDTLTSGLAPSPERPGSPKVPTCHDLALDLDSYVVSTCKIGSIVLISRDTVEDAR